jgi:DNA-binding transcriptional ArsR family regulator
MNKPKSNDFSDISEPMLGRVADCFQALSDPTRLNLLRELKDGPKTVRELVARFEWTQPNISRHLSLLAAAGLVKKSKQGAHVVYRIANPRVFRLCDIICTHVRETIADYSESGA